MNSFQIKFIRSQPDPNQESKKAKKKKKKKEKKKKKKKKKKGGRSKKHANHVEKDPRQKTTRLNHRCNKLQTNDCTNYKQRN